MGLGFSVAGFAVGFIVGMTGVGGGSLMTPILVLLFSVKPALAVGTDLLYASITKGGGIFVHQRNRTILWPVVGLLSIGSVPTSIATVFVLQRWTASGLNYDGVMTTTLGVALILTSLAIVGKERLVRFAQKERFAGLRALHSRWQKPLTVMAGILLGILVTLSSVGAGAVGAVILFFLYPRVPSKQIVGTDLAHAVPLTAIAGLGHAHLGTVDYSLLGFLLLGSLPGIFMGSQIGIKLPEYVVRPALAGMLLMIGLRFAIP